MTDELVRAMPLPLLMLAVVLLPPPTLRELPPPVWELLLLLPPPARELLLLPPPPVWKLLLLPPPLRDPKSESSRSIAVWLAHLSACVGAVPVPSGSTSRHYSQWVIMLHTCSAPLVRGEGAVCAMRHHPSGGHYTPGTLTGYGQQAL